MTFPEKPAVLEEKRGIIEFRVVNNDNSREHNIILTGLKCIFQKQLPKMPKDYIARLVYDKTHLSIAIVKHPLEVVGGITYRPFHNRRFAEIVFCAISSDQQVKGYGAHLMAHLKDYVKATSEIMHFLTYADNYAIGYFKKQGFTKEITLEKSIWMGYIKDYEGGTIMQCTMLPRIRYLEASRMLQKQKECVMAKIRAVSRSHEIHNPPPEWKVGNQPIDPLSIPAIKASGWSPSMDELSRQPRHGPNYNQLLHLLNDMQNHSSALPFAQPVNADEVPDYYNAIKNPMDLSTMEERLSNDMYPTPAEFVADAKLIFENCRAYNGETTSYVKSANKLEKYMFSQIKAIPEWSVSEISHFPGRTHYLVHFEDSRSLEKFDDLHPDLASVVESNTCDSTSLSEIRVCQLVHCDGEQLHYPRYTRLFKALELPLKEGFIDARDFQGAGIPNIDEGSEWGEDSPD